MTTHHEFILPDITEDDELHLMVEHAEDPKLNEYWAELLRHRPGTALFIRDMALKKANGDTRLYEKIVVAALETALTLGEAALRSSSAIDTTFSSDESGGDGEFVTPQDAPHDDQ